MLGLIRPGNPGNPIALKTLLSGQPQSFVFEEWPPKLGQPHPSNDPTTQPTQVAGAGDRVVR